MAMLRNLRNMLKAGISSKHHNMVIKKLSDEVFSLDFVNRFSVLTRMRTHTVGPFWCFLVALHRVVCVHAKQLIELFISL